MRSRTHLIGVATLAGAALVWTTSQAHHSFAMFDTQKKLTITGTITEFQWTNPHTFIEIDVHEKDGAVKHYSIECSSISILKRSGWNRQDLKPGDRAKIVLFPLRDGRQGGLMDSVTLPNGKTLDNANNQ